MKQPASFDTILSRLHLRAVLPALEDLTALSAPARDVARAWNFSLRMQLAGGPGATLTPHGDGKVTVATTADVGGATQGSGAAPTPKADLTLLFLSPAQLNRTFLNQSALPPVPLGKVWRLAELKPFTALTKLLDAALQPTPEALQDPAFLRMHLRLLFRVLIGAIPVIGEMDPPSAHTLAATPPGLALIRMDALDSVGWVRHDGRGGLTSGLGEAPAGQAPDAVIKFRDEAAATAALQSRLDNAAAVGLGQIEISGLVPLADGLGAAMDRVERYLK